ncbi:MAG TPA: sigma 54-interacting transcriptional regulator [Candidatus Eremiobacteraceae bacterium]|nr:sigma 54-interacting transcriptional regulator [Candidatus Eremiobacteraceae bacterium]
MGSHARQGVKDAQIAVIPDPLRSNFVEGVSPSMRSVEAVMLEVAQSEVPVLLLAERGAGKKATARRVHELSRRAGRSFRVVSCSSLIANELADSQGEIEVLGGGTVFLEELAELSLEAQAWLLGVLTRGSANGGPSSGQARLICGSARDLEAEVRAGNLREDLYYRVSGVCLRLPPLRQRREDIPILTDYFLRKYGRDFQRTVPALSEETHRLFQEYSWPGNLRELENAAKAIVALGDETVAMGGLRAMLLRSDHGGNGGRISLKQASRAASREAEKEMILRALTRTRWNRRRAAQELQISYKALLYKLKQMGCSEYEAS